MGWCIINKPGWSTSVHVLRSRWIVDARNSCEWSPQDLVPLKAWISPPTHILSHSTYQKIYRLVVHIGNPSLFIFQGFLPSTKRLFYSLRERERQFTLEIRLHSKNKSLIALNYFYRRIKILDLSDRGVIGSMNGVFILVWLKMLLPLSESKLQNESQKDIF